MLKNEFLIMQEQDLETSSNNLHKQMLLCFKHLLQDYPEDIEINESKTCAECYDKMFEKAKKEHIEVFGPEDTKNFIIEYLGITKILHSNAKMIKLEDFI